MSAFKFGQVVRHVKTGKLYSIRVSATFGRLEHNLAPAYGYQRVPFGDDPVVYFRAAYEMEDGRFELVLNADSEVVNSENTPGAERADIRVSYELKGQGTPATPAVDAAPAQGEVQGVAINCRDGN